MLWLPGPGCSKLTMSLVNVSLKFQTLISDFRQYFLLKKWELLQCKSLSHFFIKNIGVFNNKIIQHLTSWPLNKLVKLTKLWTTGPRALNKREYLVIIFLISHWNHMLWPLIWTISSKLFRWGITIYETICCDPSCEPSHWDGSDDGSQLMFFCRINKKYPLLSPNTPSYLEFWTPH